MSRSEITDKGGTKSDVPFPIGSKIRRTVCDWHKLKVGGVYTVRAYENGHIKVEEFDCAGASPANFELVSQASPKSEWFGFKYQVTSESSKLLQEAVFKDGGGWWDSSKDVVNVKYDNFWMFVTDKGEISWSTINTGTLPKKQPPQPAKVEPPKKDFVAGKWYKCKSSRWDDGAFTVGEYYLVDSVAETGNLRIHGKAGGWFKERFDINSELDYDPDAKESVDTDVKESKIRDWVQVSINGNDLLQHKHIGNVATTNVGDVNMSNQNRVVSVKFFDDDAGLKAEQSLVAEYQITTRVSDAMTVSKVLLTEDVAGDIAAHNEVRAATVDLHILKQTGNKVTLQPIEFEDLRVEVRQI